MTLAGQFAQQECQSDVVATLSTANGSDGRSVVEHIKLEWIWAA